MIEKVCNKCGYTWTQFTRSGLLGCPHCYSQFQRELLPTLKKLHKETIHKGSGPKISGADKQLFSEYKRLLSEKEYAVMQGDFPRMAEISLELTELIEELKSRGIL